MRNITRETFYSLLEKGKVCILGVQPHLIKPDGSRIPVKLHPECGQRLKIENYGGGHRYHCPHCDTYVNDFGRHMISWTNDTPPADMTCHR